MNRSHSAFMQRALELAARGKSSVSPNPCVGCVIVKNGKIVGEGHHEEFGGPHAEVIALRKAGPLAAGATAYITLEPCTHWGKTPPCAPIVINAGIKRVIIAMKDPNPIVSGNGIAELRKARIKTEVGIEEKAARHLNRSYILWMTEKRPYVVLKMAMTLDGKIASKAGESKWISSETSRRLVHKLRAESDAVLVGSRTAMLDKPTLTSHGHGRDPLKIILQRKTNLKTLLSSLATNNVAQLLVEGGGETAWRFVSENLVDELYFFIAPKILGGRDAISPVEGEGFKRIKDALPLHDLSVTRVEQDILVHAFTKKVT